MKIKFGWKFWITLILGVAAYCFFFYILFIKSDLKEIKNIFSQSDPFYLFFAFLASIFMILGQGFFLKKIFDIYKVKIPFDEAVRTWLMTVPLGAVTAGLSGPAIIFYKLQRKKVPIHLSTIVIISYYIFYLVPNILFILIAGIASFSPQFIINPTVLIGSIIFIIIAGIILFLLLSQKGRALVLMIVRRVAPKYLPDKNGKEFLTLSSKSILEAIGASALEVVTAILIFVFCLVAIGAGLKILTILQGFAAMQVLAIFSPSGGGLGIVEIGLTGFMKLNGLNISQATLFVIAFRFFEFWIPAILGWIIFSHRGFGYFQEINKSKN
jgi:phosphatidylglycerol lysyltransferase